MFHIPGNGKQLTRIHDILRSIDNNLIGRLKRNGLIFAQGQRIERAIGRILMRTLQRQRPGAGGQLFLLIEVETDSDDGGMGHDGRGDGPRGLQGCEEAGPALEEAHQGVEADFGGAGHQPAHDFAATPVQGGQG